MLNISETTIESNGMLVRFDVSKKIIEEIYKNYSTPDEIKEMKLKEVELIAKYGITTYLSQMLKFQGTIPALQDWVKNEWTKMIYDAGIRNIAMVLPTDVYAIFALQNAMKSEIISLMRVEKFTSYEKALIWCETFAQ